LKTIKTKERYLSNDSKVVNEVKNLILNKNEEGKYSLLQAYTGTGKSHLMFNILKENKIQYIYVLPNIAVVNNLSKEKDIPAINSETKNNFKKILESGRSLVCTVDQLKNISKIQRNILKNVILIIDEAHYYVGAVSFRKKAINYLIDALKRTFRNIVMVTATPGPLELLRYPSIDILKIETPTHTKYTFNSVFIEEGNIDKMKEFINKLDGQVIMYNNTSKLDNKVITKDMEGWYSINADTPKSDKLRKAIIEEQTIPEYVKVLIATDIFTAGLNIKHSNVKHAILNNAHDPTILAQFIARIRDKEELTVHYFNGTEAPAIKPKFDEYVEPLSNFSADAMIALDKLKNRKVTADYMVKHYKDFELVNYILRNNVVESFEVNEFAVVNKTYRNILHNAPYYNILTYAANLPEFKNIEEADDFFEEHEDIFTTEQWFDVDVNELKKIREEEREANRIEEEERTNKILGVIERNFEILFVQLGGVTYVAHKEGLNEREVKELRRIVARYDKYTTSSVKLLIRIDKDKKFRDRLFYQSIPAMKKPILDVERIVKAVKNNYRVGSRKPKFDYSTDEGREFKKAFDAIWEVDKETKRLTKKRTDWKDLTGQDRKELKRMFYLKIKKEND